MKTFLSRAVVMSALLWSGCILRGAVLYSAYSAYHHIQVIDEGNIRTLSFNGSMETRMSRLNPMQGHFEYTEYFHMPWLWNTNIQRVLMIGLGGGSTQRSYQNYYKSVMVDTVELDPAVVGVAKTYFRVAESPTLRIHTNDGRIFLRRTTNRYDVVLMDAYATTRYGSSVPPHLTTKEFFALAHTNLTTNGVMAYNIIGQIDGWNGDFLASIFRTMREVFPQVYLFPAAESQNVVLVATKSPARYDEARVQKEGSALMRMKKITLPDFAKRLESFTDTAPLNATSVPVLTDARAGVERLLR